RLRPVPVRPAGGDAAGRAELQQQSGTAAGAAAGNHYAGQCPARPPAAFRIAPGSPVGRAGRRRPAVAPRLMLSRADVRPRRGLQIEHGAALAHLDLQSDSRLEVDLWLPTRRRGWLDLQRIRLSTTQPLGLFRAWSWIWPDTPLLVYPAPETPAPPLPDGGSGNART